MPVPLSDKPASPDVSLVPRVVSALVLAPLAIGAAWIGGWPFALFWGLAAFGVWWEWTALVAVSAARLVMFTGVGALGLALTLAATGRYLAAVIVIALGAGATNVVAPAGRGAWVGGGVIYAGSLLIAPIVLRHDSQLGFIAIIFLFGVVWTTDILGYFVGRVVGGLKLWPSISPNKTWSGAIAGACGGAAVGWAVAHVVSPADASHLAVVGLVLSIASQGGDLFESAVKRRFGAKDTSQMIPGHGGLMDRLDGFIVATTVAALYGMVRSGLDGPAQGLLQW
ncbi:MAG: phosphatidate cytidylyltransferase [Rhizobiales bacterium]|nr:phosphatidate cytidylyltransferase [Hyphomicrobiales bacterium]